MPSVTGSMKKLGIDKFNVDQRLDLLEEIWESLDQEERDSLPIPPEHLAELDARMADALAHPDDTIPWEEVEKDLLPKRKK